MLYENFITESKVSNKIIKTDFSIGNIELYFETKKIMINLNVVKEEKILIILSSVNNSYNISQGLNSKSTALADKIIKNLPITSLIKDGRKSYPLYYSIIKTDDLKKIESTFFESSLIFRFFHLLGLKSDMPENEVIAEINKHSFYNIYNVKRWPRIADWELFFDSEHLCGRLQELALSN